MNNPKVGVTDLGSNEGGGERLLQGKCKEIRNKVFFASESWIMFPSHTKRSRKLCACDCTQNRHTSLLTNNSAKPVQAWKWPVPSLHKRPSLKTDQHIRGIVLNRHQGKVPVITGKGPMLLPPVCDRNSRSQILQILHDIYHSTWTEAQKMTHTVHPETSMHEAGRGGRAETPEFCSPLSKAPAQVLQLVRERTLENWFSNWGLRIPRGGGGLWSYAKMSMNPWLPTLPLPSLSPNMSKCAEEKAEMLKNVSPFLLYSRQGPRRGTG